MPAGLECPEVWFGPGVDRVPLIVSAHRDCGPFAGGLTLAGHTGLGTVELVRPARGAAVIFSGPPVTSARLTGEVPLATGAEAPWLVTATPDWTEVSQGSIIDVAVSVEVLRGVRTAPVTLTGLGIPAEPSGQVATIPGNQSKGWFSLQVPENLPPGPYTFAIQAGSVVRVPTPASGGKPQGFALTTCSNPMTIQVGPAAFDLWVDPRNPRKIQRGQVIQVRYGAIRRNGFIGKIRTELAAPEGVVGLRGRGVTFVGPTDSGVIQVIASDDAPLGRQPFLRLEAVGTVEDEPIHHVGRFLDLEITN